MRTAADFSKDWSAKSIADLPSQSWLERSGLRSAMKTTLKRLSTTVSGNAEPKIWQTRDRFETIVWHTYDPATGKSNCFSSEAEVRVWLDQRYSS